MFYFYLFGNLIKFSYASSIICNSQECEIELVLRHRFTQSCKGYVKDPNSYNQKFEWFPVEFVDGEITVAHNTLFTDNMLSISNIILDESTCILGNGIKQQVIAINDEYPGPNIEVLAGSLLHVKVINNLYGGVSPSIHWHGIQMKNGYYWSEGTRGITSCGIEAGSSFTYSFEVDEPGTFFYQAMSNGERLDGLYGGLFVHKESIETPSMSIFIQDHWDDAIFLSGGAGWAGSSMYLGGSGESTSDPDSTRVFNSDGVEMTNSPVKKVLINGRMENVDLPTYEFEYTDGDFVRLISAAAEAPLELTVDEHVIFVSEFDGFPITESAGSDYLILNPGETALVQIIRRNDTISSKVWMRTQPIGIYANVTDFENKNLMPEHIYESRAIFKTSLNNVIDGESRSCSETMNKCTVFNSLVPEYPQILNKNGVDLGKILENQETYSQSNINYYPNANDQVFSVHLNTNYNVGVSFNGVQFKNPTSPFSTGQENENSCDKLTSGPCTNSIKIPLGSIVELTMTSYVVEALDRTHHPLYLHGNPFWVMSIGYDEHEDGVALNKGNPHFKCKDEDCTETEKVEEIAVDYSKQFMKRTSVTVPANGYVLVRFKADNPGIWLLQCNTLTHYLQGQSILFDISDKGVPRLPDNFPSCPVNTKHKILDNHLVPLKDIRKDVYENSARSFFLNTILTVFIVLCL